MLAPAVANQAFQFACPGGSDVLEAMCAVQHIELAQSRIRVTAMRSSGLFAHEQTFGGASLEPKYHQASCGYGAGINANSAIPFPTQETRNEKRGARNEIWAQVAP